MRKFETIKVNINGKINSAQINTEENSVLRAKCGGGDNPHKPTEFALDLKNNRIYCKKCGREFKIVEKSWVKRAEAEAEAEAERLANLQVRSAGKCWETGIEYFYLSARVSREIWGKISHLFSYFKKGWTRDSEMEFDGFEPCGWLTVKPEEVENILVKEGLIKAENTLSARAQAKAEAEAEAEAEAKAKAEKIAPLIEKRDILDEQINKCFDLSEEKRQMSDAEASRNMKLKMTSTMFYNVTDEEIMLIQDFSDFTSGIAIPYNEKIAEWVKEVVELQKAILTV